MGYGLNDIMYQKGLAVSTATFMPEISECGTTLLTQLFMKMSRIVLVETFTLSVSPQQRFINFL